MGQARKKDDIHIRSHSNVKKVIERAAKVKGLSLSDYILTSMYEKAQTDLEDLQKLVLTNKDRDMLLELLESPPEPSAFLLQSFKEHKRIIKD